MQPERYLEVKASVADAGFADEIEWAQTVQPPKCAEEFALEAIYIICNSGMRWTVARKIYDAIVPILLTGESAAGAFRHKGKVAAIDLIWADRERLFGWYMRQRTDVDRLEFIARLPWVGGITKYHLAKNLGVDCAKPDRWLVRLAEFFGTNPHSLCQRLSIETGDRIATVDLVLWRAAERGLLSELGQTTARISDASKGE